MGSFFVANGTNFKSNFDQFSRLNLNSICVFRFYHVQVLKLKNT